MLMLILIKKLPIVYLTNQNRGKIDKKLLLKKKLINFKYGGLLNEIKKDDCEKIHDKNTNNVLRNLKKK